jgi:hypothetical protein
MVVMVQVAATSDLATHCLCRDKAVGVVRCLIDPVMCCQHLRGASHDSGGALQVKVVVEVANTSDSATPVASVETGELGW